MSESRSHESVVATQFGPRAEAYVRSETHAKGPDLDEIEELVRGKGFDRALDLGCGGGHVAVRVSPHVNKVVAYDLSQDMLRAVTDQAERFGLRNIETVPGMAESLPFKNHSFECVLSRFSAHHWHNFRQGIREARRVLKPGGIAIFADVISPGVPVLDTFLQAVELFRDVSHIRDYSKGEWLAALRDAGFSVRSVTERRLRLDFTSWIERMQTPKCQVDAILSIQRQVSENVAKYYAFEADGSFEVDTVSFVGIRD